MAATLRDVLGDLAVHIDHIGSTSVPGLAAKDVLDIQVAAASLEIERLVEPFSRGGFELVERNDRDHMPEGSSASDDGWRKVFFRPSASGRRVHVHVRIASAPNARYALLFRDYLREHLGAAAAYAALKRKLAALEPPLDVGVYADVKDPACDVIIAAAEDWAAQVGWKSGTSDG